MEKEINGNSTRSYPPEDIVVEGYRRYLQKEALQSQIKWEENVRIKPISCSMQGEFDIRGCHSEMIQLSYIYARLLDLRQLLHFLPAKAANPPPKRKKVVGSGTCAPGGTGVGSLPKALFFPILLGDA